MKVTRFEVIALLIACLLSLQSVSAAPVRRVADFSYGGCLTLTHADKGAIRDALDKHKADCISIELGNKVLSQSDWMIISRLPKLELVSLSIENDDGVKQLEYINNCKKVSTLILLIKLSAKDGDSYPDMSKCPVMENIEELDLTYADKPSEKSESSQGSEQKYSCCGGKKGIDFAKFCKLKGLSINKYGKVPGSFDLNGLLPLADKLESLRLHSDSFQNISSLDKFVLLKKCSLLNLSLGTKTCSLAGSIEQLDISLSDAGSEFFSQLPNLKNLKRLDIDKPVSAAEIISISKVSSLEELSIQTGDLGDSELAALGNLHDLKELRAESDESLHGSFLAAFAKDCKLSKLEMGIEELDYAGVKAIGMLTNLESIHLYKLHDWRKCIIKPDWFVEFDNLVNMRDFDVVTPQISTDRWASMLGHMPHLQNIDLSGSDLSDKGIAFLSGCTDLEQLTVSSTKIRGETLDKLSKLNKLETLSLNGCTLSDLGLKNLALLTKLDTLDLGSAQFPEDSLSAITKLSNLTSLNLCNTDIKGSCLKYIGALPKLRYLNVSGTKITNSSLANLVHSNLVELNVSDTEITEKAICYLEQMKKLAKLDGNHCGFTCWMKFIAKKDGQYRIVIQPTPVRDDSYINAAEKRAFMKKDLVELDELLRSSPSIIELAEEREMLQGILDGHEQAAYENRLAQIDKRISEYPEYNRSYEDRAFVLYWLGRYDAALPDFEKALNWRRNPGFILCGGTAGPWRNATFNLLVKYAYASNAVKNYGLALEKANSLVERDRLSIGARLLRAYANINLGNSDNAIYDLDRCIEINPKNAAAYAFRALAYKRLDKKELAAKDEAKAKELGFEDSASGFALWYKLFKQSNQS